MKPVDCEELYRNGRHYDLLADKLSPYDLPFYLDQAEKYGDPVLELACGTGRVSIPLAQQGHQVTGLDISRSMLSHARKKTLEKGVIVEWINGDCRDFRLNKRFNLIVFPYNSMHHILDRESLESCLSSVKMHLMEEGRFIIDVFNPCLDILIRDKDKRFPVGEYMDPDGRGKIIITESGVYDAAAQIKRIKWHYKIGDQDDEIINEWSMRIFYPQELDSMLHYNGFEIEAKYGNYDGTPFASDSPKQLIVCGKQS